MTGTSSVCQFYDSPRQLICFWRTFFVCAKLLYSSRPKLCPTARIVFPYTSSSSDRHTVLHTLWYDIQNNVSLFVCCLFTRGGRVADFIYNSRPAYDTHYTFYTAMLYYTSSQPHIPRRFLNRRASKDSYW
jgi:hypothetical protein